jgi:hypothetical protein
MSIEENLETLITEVIAEDEQAAARTGTKGSFCYFCGYKAPLRSCDCQFPESFGCGSGKEVCSDCRNAHVAIGRHLQEMFTAKRVDRVSSIRNRMFRELRMAAEGVRRGQQLRFALAQRDPCYDEPEAFRHNTLRSFHRARFLDFVGLAKRLGKEKERAIYSTIIRAGLAR